MLCFCQFECNKVIQAEKYPQVCLRWELLTHQPRSSVRELQLLFYLVQGIFVDQIDKSAVKYQHSGASNSWLRLRCFINTGGRRNSSSRSNTSTRLSTSHVMGIDAKKVELRTEFKIKARKRFTSNSG